MNAFYDSATAESQPLTIYRHVSGILLYETKAWHEFVGADRYLATGKDPEQCRKFLEHALTKAGDAASLVSKERGMELIHPTIENVCNLLNLA